MTFLGGDLLGLIERVLPRRFGGGADDFQLVERRDGAASRVEVVVSPRLGELPDDEVTGAVLGHFRSQGGRLAMMAEVWRTAGTLEVVRREPHATSGGKVLPLHEPR